MSERKGPGLRGSLMDLGKPRLAQTPLTAPIDEAERRILAREAEPPSNHAAQSAAAQPAVAEPAAQVQPLPDPHPTPPRPAPEPDPPPAALRTHTPSTDIVSRLRKERRPIAVVGFKLPATLKDELQSVAQFNDTDMTRIVIAALERLLPELPHPPE